MEVVTVQTSQHAQMINVTDQIRALVEAAGITAGRLHLHVPHTTAAITINENADPDVVHDLLADLERLVPWRQGYYQHGEGNSAAHLKASLIGCGLTVLVERGALVMGTWQGIYFCEFDGPRTRRLHVQVTSE